MSTTNNQNVSLFKKQILNFNDNNAIENGRTLFIVYIVFFILIIEFNSYYGKLYLLNPDYQSY